MKNLFYNDLGVQGVITYFYCRPKLIIFQLNIVRVFSIVIRDRVKAQKTTNHSHNNPFLTEKIVKNRYYGNGNFSLARDRIEVSRNHMSVRKLHKSV